MHGDAVFAATCKSLDASGQRPPPQSSPNAQRAGSPAMLYPIFAAATRRPRRNDGHDKPQRLRMRSCTARGLQLNDAIPGGVHS
jgi:hypothetical protein